MSGHTRISNDEISWRIQVHSSGNVAISGFAREAFWWTVLQDGARYHSLLVFFYGLLLFNHFCLIFKLVETYGWQLLDRS